MTMCSGFPARFPAPAEPAMSLRNACKVRNVFSTRKQTDSSERIDAPVADALTLCNCPHWFEGKPLYDRSLLGNSLARRWATGKFELVQSEIVSRNNTATESVHTERHRRFYVQKLITTAFERALGSLKLVHWQRLQVVPLQKTVCTVSVETKWRPIVQQASIHWERSCTDYTQTSCCTWCTIVTVCAKESVTVCVAAMVWINIKGTAVISVISAVLCFLINMLNYIHEEGHADSYNLLRSCSNHTCICWMALRNKS